MRIWFHRLAACLGFEETVQHSVRAVLETAALRSASIGIGSLDGAALPNPLSGHVVELLDDHFVISRPQEGSVRRELVSGETLHLSIASDAGFHHGDVEVLGRWVDRSGPSPRYGYRLSLPRMLVHEERRGLHRVPVAFDLAPIATLLRPQSFVLAGEGTVLDVSEGGARVRIAPVATPSAGETFILKAAFPAFIPDIETRVEVAHLAPARQDGLVDLGLRFETPPAELGRAIRALEVRRLNRPGAAA
jgi:hypothetical protein